MLRIGLTGGIGSGKTTVGRLFEALGVPVIDADAIARTEATPGHAGYRAIVEHFSNAVLDDNGAIDRARLRDLVFNEPAQRQRLEARLHPLVFAAMEQAITELKSPYCILVIPLLLETNCRQRVDRILLVDVAEAVQYQRVQARDGLDGSRIQQILNAQCTRPVRLAAADDIVHNDGDLASLKAQVATLHQDYLDLASDMSKHSTNR